MLKEANRIASFITLSEIPQKFKHLKVLGRGATTIALQENEKSVLIFTRDIIKAEYLRDCLENMAEYIEEYYPSKIHHIKGVSNIPVMVIRMPMLYPLSPENVRKVKQELKAFDAFQPHYYKGIQQSQKFAQKCDEFAGEYPESILEPFCHWILNYDSNQYSPDFGSRQFKQDDKGNIIFLDPIISKELMELYYKK